MGLQESVKDATAFYITITLFIYIQVMSNYLFFLNTYMAIFEISAWAWAWGFGSLVIWAFNQTDIDPTPDPQIRPKSGFRKRAVSPWTLVARNRCYQCYNMQIV